MASGSDPCPEHPKPTTRRKYRYCFYNKHHGAGSPDDGEWSRDVTRDDEFAIFDQADELDLRDDKGHFYGIRPPIDGRILDLGTQQQQVAKFWNPETRKPTHGFPAWPLDRMGPTNRGKEVVPRIVLTLMRDRQLLTGIQCKRGLRGDRL